MNQRPTAIVTGASSGIGKSTAKRFALEGYDVCLVARRGHLLEVIRNELPPGNHLVCAGDYSQADDVDRVAKDIDNTWKCVDVLVNCAGIFRETDVLESSWEHWRESLDVMLGGAMLMSRLAAARMANAGRIIHVTSIHGSRVEAKTSGYAVAKAAIDQFCRCLALELAPKNILVNAIAPGFVQTPMSTRSDGTSELDSEWFEQNYIKGHHLPLKRAAQPEEIASVAFFLAGLGATYITGQVITVDGGLTITF